MSNFTDFFPAAGASGGGGIPKYENFTTSGTFTPSQALIDAGGRIGLFIVGAGQSGQTDGRRGYGGGGGEVKMEFITLTSTNAITVTIGASSGGSTTFAASTAGAGDIVALGGNGKVNNSYTSTYGPRIGAGFGAGQGSNSTHASGAGSGVLGYGAGGASYIGAGIANVAPNSGQGGGFNGKAGGSGFVRVTWFE